MRLDDQILNIYSELDLMLCSEEKAEWLARNFNKALVRAKKLEKLAEAVNEVMENKTPGPLAQSGGSE